MCVAVMSLMTRKFFCRVPVVCLILCLTVFGSSSAAAVDDDVAEWWESDMLVAVGYGMPSGTAHSAGQARLLARQAAKSDAYRKLAEQAAGIRITADETMEPSEIKAVVVGAQIISEEQDALGGCTIVMTVPIYGVQNSIAQAALERVDKKEFPKPVGAGAVEGDYTGLIIDCGDLELNPVLAPVIQSTDNQSIYSYSHLDYDEVISKGMVSYARRDIAEVPELESVEVGEKVDKVEHREIFVKPVEVHGSESSPVILGATAYNSRAGSKPLVIRVVRLDRDGSCPVISTSDANKILRENQASHFLNGGFVIFMSNRIRGMRL